MLRIEKLTCEYRIAHLGLDEAHPRFGWQFQTDQFHVLQTAYHIQVALDVDFVQIVWDSGIVHSDESVHIAYDGNALRPRTRYYARVEAWDNHNEHSGWSKTAWWETGLMSPSAWRAEWISTDAAEEQELMASPLYRKEFELDGQIASARIYVSALGLYELRLNGERVGNSFFTPGWTSYQKCVQYQTYDVTSLLRHGKNAIGAMLGNGWYAGYIAWSGEKGFYGKERALILELYVRYQSGEEFILYSDGSWKTCYGPVRMSEIYHGETYDARLEPDGWDKAEFSDADWKNAVLYPHTKSVLIAQENEPVKIMQELSAQKLHTAQNGEIILDFGQELTGFVRLQVRGKRGDCIRLRHGEILDSDGNLYTDNLRGAKQTTQYILKGNDIETYAPHFTYQGFRYVAISGDIADVCAEDFTACVLYSAMQDSGSFSCSNELVNQLQHNIQWSQMGNFLEVPTDCPQRAERHGWTGDAQMFIRTACFNTDSLLFYSKWLNDLAADQLPDGGVPHVIPNVRSEADSSSAAWGDAAVICPWTLYICYADKRLLRRQYTSMKRWVDYIRAQGENPYLWNSGAHFGDWLALDNGIGAWIGRTAPDFISTAFYAYSTQLVAQAAVVLGEEIDVITYRTLHKQILQNFRQEFVTPNGRLTERTQTAYVLALKFHLLEDKDVPRAVQELVKLLEESNYHLTTGFVGTPYLCHVLSENGRTDLAYRLLLQTDCPSWLYPITKGATTIWEHWDGIREDGSLWDERMNSFNHYSYGAVGDWLYRVVAGLNADAKAPGYRHIRLTPHPCSGLTYAEAKYQSMYGEIISAWHMTAGQLRISCTIPPNTTATLLLPNTDPTQLKAEPGAMDISASAFQTSDGVEVMLGSGSYVFCYPIKETVC